MPKKVYKSAMMNIKAHLKYLAKVLRHKYLVFVECCKLGIPVRGICHDCSKFLPSEWFPSVKMYYGSNAQYLYFDEETGLYESTVEYPAYNMAYLLHQKRNRHHWQWWVLPIDGGIVKVLEMPDKYRREMLADWRAANRAVWSEDRTAQWYEANKDTIQLHPKTRKWLESMLFSERLNS